MSIFKIFWINIELRSPSAFKCIAASGNEEPIPEYIQSLVVIIKILVLLMEPINTRHQCWKFFWTCSLVPSFRLLGSCGEISTWRSEFCGYIAKLPTSPVYNYKVFIVQDLFWTEQRFVLGRNVEKSPCIAAICFLYLISQNSANQYLSSTCWSKCARPWQK